MDQFFWLFCGIWCGLGGAIFTWQSLRKPVASGKLSQQEVKSFVQGIALWVFVPSLLLWGLQSSIDGEAPPEYFKWPDPQRYSAICLQVFIWCALIYWVFFNGGAITLSKLRGAVSKWPSFLHSPMTFKCIAVLIVVSGLFALLSNYA